MTPEKSLRQWISSNSPPLWHLQWIESSTSNGIPDLNVAGDRLEWWWELKAGTKFPELRPEQWAWLNRRAAAGGNVGVLHRRADGEQWWYLHGIKGAEIRAVSGKIKIVSSPIAQGLTMDLLRQAVLKHYSHV